MFHRWQNTVLFFVFFRSGFDDAFYLIDRQTPFDEPALQFIIRIDLCDLVA
jgi:hypothetical protein